MTGRAELVPMEQAKADPECQKDQAESSYSPGPSAK
jgi:hypothetical protein